MPQKKKTKTGLVLSFLKLFVFLYTQSLQSGPTHCDPTDNSLPGSSVHGILQARILEWVAMSTSRGSSWPRDRTCISYISCNGRWVFFLPLVPPGKAGHPFLNHPSLWRCTFFGQERPVAFLASDFWNRGREVHGAQYDCISQSLHVRRPLKDTSNSQTKKGWG